MCQYSILAVDDEAAWLKVLVRFFSEHNYKVYTAGTCAEGLRLAKLHRPDCILLDYLMPSGDGGQFCDCLHTAADIRKIPVIMVSSYPQEETNAYFTYKTDGFVQKGGDLIKLLGMVETVLRRVRLERGVEKRGDIRLEKKGFRVFLRSSLLARLSENQYRILSLLLDKSPAYVSEDLIAREVFESDFAPDKIDAIRGVLYRLRCKLGPRIGGRVKNKSGCGWTYLQPRSRV